MGSEMCIRDRCLTCVWTPNYKASDNLGGWAGQPRVPRVPKVPGVPGCSSIGSSKAVQTPCPPSRVQPTLMAAIALLKASGLLNKGTASSHATSSSQSGSTATEHASLLPETGATERLLQTSTSRLQTAAYEENFFLEDKDLEKIIALLLWMSQDFHLDFHTDRIHNAALDVVIKQSKDKMHSLTPASVTKLSQLIDTMMLNKDLSLIHI